MTMLPLYHDAWFTFRFADDRIIPRFHLEIVEKGSHVSLIKIDPETGQRLGSALVRRGLECCREKEHRIVVVLGHPDFYPRFGFSANLAERLESPYGGGPSFMVAELAPGALDGVVGKVVYSPPFKDV